MLLISPLFRMFLTEEKDYLRTLERDVDLNDHFPEEIIEFLKKKNRLHQIKSKVITNLKIMRNIMLL